MSQELPSSSFMSGAIATDSDRVERTKSPLLVQPKCKLLKCERLPSRTGAIHNRNVQRMLSILLSLQQATVWIKSALAKRGETAAVFISKGSNCLQSCKAPGIVTWNFALDVRSLEKKIFAPRLGYTRFASIFSRKRAALFMAVSRTISPMSGEEKICLCTTSALNYM